MIFSVLLLISVFKREGGILLSKKLIEGFRNLFLFSPRFFIFELLFLDQEISFNFGQIYPDDDNSKMILLRGVINFPIWTEQSETWLPIESLSSLTIFFFFSIFYFSLWNGPLEIRFNFAQRFITAITKRRVYNSCNKF